MTNSENNKRIAKNTAMLYVRMLLIMGVSLYTSRVVLQTLGVTDFGIYNVVGGVVSFLGFINGSLSGASSRFITFALGKGDKKLLSDSFSTILLVHYALAVVILILAETVGLWFVLEKMVIPLERQSAAMWVYQCSVITVLLSIVSTPYTSLVIAYERMSTFAYLSIFETLAKLLVVYLLMVVSFDKLALYAVLLMVIQLIVRLIYSYYCRRNFSESKSKLTWNRPLAKEIGTYAGWTLNGHFAVIGYTQGLNILLNLFFGPAVNAARGIAVQVQSAVSQFSGNVQMAFNPQITKSYAQNNLDYMHTLICNSSKYSFLLIFMIGVPVFLEVEQLLTLWLGIVPEHTASFFRITMFIALESSFVSPVLTSVHATGNLKRFQLIEGSVLLSIVPISYLALKFLDTSPESVFYIFLFVECVTQIIRIWIVFPMIQLSKWEYIKRVFYPLLIIVAISIILPLIVYFGMQESFLRLVSICFASLFSVSIASYFLAISKQEQQMINNKIKRFI